MDLPLSQVTQVTVSRRRKTEEESFVIQIDLARLFQPIKIAGASGEVYGHSVSLLASKGIFINNPLEALYLRGVSQLCL
jgi:hypothetical protein